MRIVYSVGIVRQLSGMEARWLSVFANSMRFCRYLGVVCLGGLGCTALMKAKSPKHPPGCLQFAKMNRHSFHLHTKRASTWMSAVCQSFHLHTRRES